MSLALLKSTHSWLFASSLGTCRLDLAIYCYLYRQLLTDSPQIALIPVYSVRSVVFCIGSIMPICCVRAIPKSSRYTLEFDCLLIPCQFIGQIDWHAFVCSSCSLSLANGALRLGVSIVHVNTSFGTPGGTRRISTCLSPKSTKKTTSLWTRTS